MLLLASSLLAIALGPGLAHLSKDRPRLLEGLDGFVVATITGIVALHVVPHALAELGARAVVPLALGFWLPSWLERSRRSRFVAIDVLLVLGLSLHALIDGVALDTHEGHVHGGHDVHGGEVLAIAVSLHRIPEGLAIWWIVAPKRGARAGVLALVVAGAASCAGYFLSEPLAERVPSALFVGFEVLVAGSLLHVVAHHELTPHHGDERVHEGTAPASGFGALAGAAFLFAITREHPVTYRVARELGFGTTLETLALASAPALLLSLAASFVLHPLRARVLRRLAPDRRPRSGTELGAVLLTAALIDPWFSLARLAASIVAGAIAGAWLGAPIQARPDRCGTLRDGLRFAFGETVERTGPWILFGLFVAALVEPFVDPTAIQSIPPPLLVAGFALAGLFVPMGAAGATPLLAVLLHKGVGPGALLAFSVMAAAGDVRVLRRLARVRSRAFAARYASLLLALALASGAVGSALWRHGLEPPLHGAARAGGGALGWIALGILGLLFAAAVLRRGPRPLLQALVSASSPSPSASAARDGARDHAPRHDHARARG